MYDPSSAIKGKQAVFEAHSENAAVKALADLATDAKYDRAELTITVAPENIVAAVQAVRQAQTARDHSQPQWRKSRQVRQSLLGQGW